MVTNPRIVCGDLLGDCQGRVRRSIVDNDHLDVLIALVQYGPHSSSNESFTIANWNNNADQVIDITTLLRGIPTCIFFAGVRVGDIDGALLSVMEIAPVPIGFDARPRLHLERIA